MSKKPAKRGRPPGGEYAHKKGVMAFRIRLDTKAALQEAARKSGRTLSQQAEHEIRRGLFTLGNGQTHALMHTIGTAIDQVVNLKNPKARWWSDPYLYNQAERATHAALRLFRPEGAPPESAEAAIELGGNNQSLFAIFELLREIRLADPSAPLVRQTQRQRGLGMAKSDLGTFADRPKLYGKTADQERAQHKLGGQFAALMRKAEKQPDAMTPEEQQQIQRLFGKLADLYEAIQQSKGDQP